MANIVSKRYQTLPSSQPSVQTKDPTTVTCVYHTHISGTWRNVTISWCKNVMNYSLTISIDSASNGAVFSSKIDLKPWNIWAKKGYKSFDFDENKLEIYWDLKSAKFATGSPEPFSDFYVALISKSEVVLLIGDLKKKAYKRTKSRPSLTEAILSHKKENVFGKKSFSTRANFDHSEKRAHDVVVESSTSGPREPEMWISIDGIVTVHVENLHWKFRGNRTVLVDEKPVQVYWDVFGWLFCEPGSNLGLFIFKSGEADGGESDDDSQCSGDSNYYSVKSCKGSSSQLSHFLYAWKV